MGKKKLSARGRPGGVKHPNVNLGPPNISENTRARKLKMKTKFDIVNYSPRVQDFSAGGRTGGTGLPNVNMGPPKISEATRAIMLKFKTQLDAVKYSLSVKKILR